MNEQAVQKVIADYAMENANLRVALATLKEENEKLKEAPKEKETASKKEG